MRTSTFRGPKPWGVLKRRPSGLRRRSCGATRSESLRSERSTGPSKFLRTRLDSYGDSESSDSPYCVSAASSDCLATDDSSSITSSHYCAASSVQSSPTVSNRNSSCFSDTGSSDLTELRRVIFQNSSPESYIGNKHLRNSTPKWKHRFFEDDAKMPGMRKWDMSLSERFGRLNQNKCVLNDPDELSHRLKITAKRHLKKSFQRAGEFRSSDPSALQNLPSRVGTRWPIERLMEPMLAQSDSSLNSLTKVQFVGDSYSRSHISKNVRYARKASRSPSPGSHSTHARVISCEIVQSDKDKRDVYTKVNLSRSVHDEATTPADNPNQWGRNSNTRRSWHGQSARGSSRSSRANSISISSRTNSDRYARPADSVDRGRQVFRPQRFEQVEKPLHATLVEVQSIHGNQMCSHNSTGSLRSSSGSENSRHWSDSRVPTSGRGYHGTRNDNLRQFQGEPTLSRNSSFGRAEAFYHRPSNPGNVPGRGRLSPNLFTKTNAQLGNCWNREKDMVPTYYRQEGFLDFEAVRNIEKIRPVDRNFQTKTSISKGIAKEPVPHVVKETSFVGPSTFTKYQTPSSPSIRTRRSRSFNEKDSVSRRRLQESDFYRRRALEIASGDPKRGVTTNNPRTGESGLGNVRRPERRRRYSEGGCKPSESGGGACGYVVDQSYCDPYRQSIVEGTYSIVCAESARDAKKASSNSQETAATNDPEKVSDSVPIETGGSESSTVCDEKERNDGDISDKKPEQGLSKNDIDVARKSLESGNNERVDVSSCEKVQATESGIQTQSTEDGRNDTITKLPSNDPNVSSVVLRTKEMPESSNGVSVFIDYRNKRPVSVEYGSDVSVESQSSDSGKTSKLSLLKKGKGRSKQVSQSKSKKKAVVKEHPPFSDVNIQKSKDNGEEENPRQRLSRKDKHEQEFLSNLGKRNGNDENSETKTDEGWLENVLGLFLCSVVGMTWIRFFCPLLRLVHPLGLHDLKEQ